MLHVNMFERLQNKGFGDLYGEAEKQEMEDKAKELAGSIDKMSREELVQYASEMGVRLFALEHMVKAAFGCIELGTLTDVDISSRVNDLIDGKRPAKIKTLTPEQVKQAMNNI